MSTTATLSEKRTALEPALGASLSPPMNVSAPWRGADVRSAAAAAGAADPDSADSTAAPTSGGWVALTVKIVLGAFGIGLALLLALVALALIAGPAQARTTPEPQAASSEAGEVTDGARLMLLHCGRWVAAPLLSSEASITVTGPILRARVVQTFINEVDDDGPNCEPGFIEATYLFPLADGAAVDHLRLVVGERVIEGQIREREAAVRAHEAARAEGRRSALLEARRPNAFSTRVANIAPGETVAVQIEYQQTLAPSDDVWQLRFPTVVAPRYSREPAGGDLAQPYVVEARDDTIDMILDDTWDEWYRARAAEPTFDEAPRPAGFDASLLKPASFRLAQLDQAQLDQAEAAQAVSPASPANPAAARARPLSGRFALSVSLDAGVAITTPRSASHQIITEAPRAAGSPAWQIVVDEDGPGNRDFVLEWQARDSSLPRAGLRLEQFADQTFGLLIVDPPRGEDIDRIRLPRETTFVIDTSGSMGGQSIEQARSALLFALDRLMPGDAFNLIEFNSQHRALFDAPVVVDERHLAKARSWVRGLDARGGTEMRGAVATALGQPLLPGRLGQVVFITDGAVDYEEALVQQIGERIGDRRLFTVAIGSAPNSWFLRKAAEIGGVTLTQIGSIDEVERRMAALFTRLARPASTDLTLEISGAELLQDPQLPRDLYAGDPLIAVLRLSGTPSQVTLKGRHHAPWQMVVDLAKADSRGAGVHVLWARREIEAIDDQLQRGSSDNETRGQLRKTATTLALNHHLVSRYTSLVAVDEQVVRPQGSPLTTVATPAAMPAGWTLAQTATPAGLQLLLGSLLLIAGFALIVQRRVCVWLAGLLGLVGGRR